ncbi:hypothetical protein HYPSUDRAFT_268347 [Hypholoma sublateritium FD-334 SS-4]|uniref:FMN hydroxy acid dehydrogenase domain-containing protein n=1 Tax=Hypholoma sublateritium (strain FD-334 SS-4) TaxID=945553 RepID=A0A0D2N1H6_HYPSF|nr:hypothetical protein HYPSUDRAFT_268347 [Hypholoma sublateritium FD-334 SS-4]
MLVNTSSRDLSTELCGHRIPASILFAPIGMNKLYHSHGELVPEKISRKLGLPYCLSTAASRPLEDVARANDRGIAIKNESNGSYTFTGEGICTSPRFFSDYTWVMMPNVTISLLERAYKSGFDVCIMNVYGRYLVTWLAPD